MKSDRLSPSMAVAITALVASLGGSAIAADVPAKVSALVGSGGVKNNSLTSRDIRNGTLIGKDVKSNGLGGGAVKESSLGKVPSAGRADSAAAADTTGGLTLRKMAARLPVGGNAGLVDLGGVQIAADCQGGNPQLIARTTVNDGYIRAVVIQNANNTDVRANGDFDTTSQLDLTAGRPVGTGTLVYSRPDGAVLTATYKFDALGTPATCIFAGTAIAG